MMREKMKSPRGQMTKFPVRIEILLCVKKKSDGEVVRSMFREKTGSSRQTYGARLKGFGQVW